jgi:hypothetical protein
VRDGYCYKELGCPSYPTSANTLEDAYPPVVAASQFPIQTILQLGIPSAALEQVAVYAELILV